MPFPSLRILPIGVVFALAVAALFPSRAAAELVWTPESGWTVEGGALAGFAGEESNRALDLMNKGRRSEENGSLGSAISAYKKVSKKYPNSVYAPEALYRQAKLRQQRHQFKKAIEAYQQLVSRHPNTPHFNDAVGEEYRIAAALADGARPYIWGWFPGMKARGKAPGYFELVIANAPYSEYAPLALMNIARCHMRAHNTDAAMYALDRMINSYPDNLLAPDAYLQLAKAHVALVDGPDYDPSATKNAITYFEDFMILFPDDTSIADAAAGLSDMKTMMAESKIKMGDFYFRKRHHYAAAKIFYNEAITAYPESPVAEKAKKRLTAVESAMEKASKNHPGKKKRFWLF